MRTCQRQSATKESLPVSSRNVAVPSAVPQSPVANLSNRMLQQLFQGKLTLNEPGDHQERHADAIADAVVSSRADVRIQRKCSACEAGSREEKVHRKEKAGEHSPQVDHTSLLGAGQSLPREIRSYFEPRMGYEFSGVRIHTDSAVAKSAVALSARAYTLG